MKKKRLSDYQCGDHVGIVNHEELQEIYEVYLFKKLSKKDLKELANKLVTIEWLPNKEELNRWDGCIEVKTRKDLRFKIPFAAIIDITDGFIEEPDDELEPEILIVRDRDSENNLVKQLAAETIQSTYRRYRECKPAIKLKRVTSEERLVMDMAADTIKQGLKTIVSSKKRKKGPNGRPPLAYDLDQPYSLSNISASNVSMSSDNFSDQSPRLNSLETPPPVSLPPSVRFGRSLQPLSLHIKLIEASRLKPVKWNGRNDPYVVLTIGDILRYETEVIWSAPDTVTWTVDICITLTSLDQHSNLDLLLEVYSANLVREDQLIGTGSFQLSQMKYGTQQITVDLTYLQSKSSVDAGTLSFLATLDDTRDISHATGAINQRNNHNREKVVNRDPKPLRSETIPKKATNEEHERMNESKSPMCSADEKPKRRVSAASKESKVSHPDLEYKQKSGVENRTSVNWNDSSVPPPKSRQSNFSRPAEVTKSELSSTLPQQERKKAWEETAPAKDLYKNSNVRSAPRVKEVSSHESSKQTSPEQEKPNETDKISKSKVKKKKKVTGAPSSIVIENFVAFNLNDIDISPDLYRIVDKALDLAIYEEGSSITLHTHEVALVLDALSFPLVDGAIHPKSSAIDVESSQISLYSRSSKSTVLLSLQNPALMAAALTEFSRDKGLVDVPQLRSKQFSITEYQSITAIRQLITLVYGPWRKARKIILEASEMAVSFGGGKPCYWTSKWIDKLAAALNFPVNRFNDYNGEDFIYLDDHHIGQLIKSSILRARCRVYVKILHLLDCWWDKDIKPKDPLTSLKNQSNPSQSISKSRSPDVKKKKIPPLKDGMCIKVSPSGVLLSAYLPIQRAYAWKTTPEDLTALAQVIGSCVGIVSSHPAYGTTRLEVPGMTWVEFQDQHITMLVKEQLFHLLREYEGKIEPVVGRSVLIPTSCLEEYREPEREERPKLCLLSEIHSEKLIEGMKVRVQSLEVMSKAYEKYDWWDRPSLSVLQQFAGKIGTLVSTTSVAETGRVGVSIRGSNSIELIDALPLEALIYIPPPSDLSAQESKKKTKPKSIKKQPVLINENIVTKVNFKKPKPKEIISEQNIQQKSTTTLPVNHPPPTQMPQQVIDSDLEEAFDGGDELFPPEFDVRDEMVKDSRIFEKRNPLAATSAHSSSRPLYRPLTTFNLLSPQVPQEDVYYQPPKYEWMKKSLSSEPQVKQSTEKETNTDFRPQLTTTTLAFDPIFNDTEKKGSHANGNKSRPKTSSSSRESSRKHEDFLPTDHINLSSEFDIFIDGTKFGPKNDKMPKRPQSASSSKKNPPRPASAGSRRPSTGLSSSLKGSTKHQTHDILVNGIEIDVNTQQYDDRMKRDLRRTEKDIKIKEAALKRQAKKYGVNIDAYDTYHEV